MGDRCSGTWVTPSGKVTTPQLRKESADALEGEDGYGFASRTGGTGNAGGGKHIGVVPSIWGVSEDGIQVAGTSPVGGRGGTDGSFASSGEFSSADERGDRGPGGEVAGVASGVGRAQASSSASGSRSGMRSIGEHDNGDHASSGFVVGVDSTTGLQAFRAGTPERTVADGFQGTLCDGSGRPVPSVDGTGRSLAVFVGAAGLRE